MKFELAKAVGAAATWALAKVAHRPAANFPGKAGLVVDPNLIAHLKPRVSEGTIVVVGTNGKTTVTNLLADVLEAYGKTVACNRTGANLDSGVASALLHARTADWGVFESDELWLAKIMPQLQPDFVVLLNLFRDQLDRAGEIDHVQQRIAEALASSPGTVLVYNADDPFCQAIADHSANKCKPFGISEDLGLLQNKVADSGLCQACDAELDYAWHQYGQLGSYRCPRCGFARTEPMYRARGVRIDRQGISFGVLRHGTTVGHLESPLAGAYMAYNLLATCAAADCCNIPFEYVERAIRAFAPDNGRLQAYHVGGHDVLLNLAKNPVGLNQNLRIVADAPGPKAAAFFINDKEADGHDVSWLWDVDFEELATVDDLVVFAGGIRRNDLQVRLKYAGIDAELVDGARDLARKAACAKPDAGLFLIANYTALPDVKAELDEMARGEEAFEPKASDAGHAAVRTCTHEVGIPTCNQVVSPASQTLPHAKLTIVHLYPELLNLYGDGGNVAVLATRAHRRAIDVEVVRATRGEPVDFSQADIVFLGGGPDREQRAASRSLLEQATALRDYVEGGGVLLAICGGFQILGRTWLLGNETVPGLGILDIETKRAKGGSHNRLVGNVALESPLAKAPVVGYENHAGRTFLGDGCEPFGRIIDGRGEGNNGRDGFDGARYRNVVATYLHGPLLAKNPEIADWLIEKALARRAAENGLPAPTLSALDDRAEHAANAFMCTKLGVRAR